MGIPLPWATVHPLLFKGISYIQVRSAMLQHSYISDAECGKWLIDIIICGGSCAALLSVAWCGVEQPCFQTCHFSGAVALMWRVRFCLVIICHGGRVLVVHFSLFTFTAATSAPAPCWTSKHQGWCFMTLYTSTPLPLSVWSCCYLLQTTGLPLVCWISPISRFWD